MTRTLWVSRAVQDCPDPAFAVDGESRIIDSNRAARELLGWDSGKVRGRSLHETFEARDAFGNVFCPCCGLRAMADRGEPINAFAVEVGDGLAPTRLLVAVEAVAGSGSSEPVLVFRLKRDRRRRGEDLLLEQLLDRHEALRAHQAEAVAPAASAKALTKRQLEVLRLLADGRSTAQVAAELSLSVNTVRNHQQNVLQRLGVHSQANAVAMAIRLGLI